MAASAAATSGTAEVAAPALLRGTGAPLRVRWLGTVRYHEAWALQRALHADAAGTGDDRLLLLEHPPTYTLGRNADRSHVLGDPAEHGIDLIEVDRGGDVTYHGPGQLVAYPIVTLPPKGAAGGPPDTPAYVATLEQVLIEVLAALGLPGAGRHHGYPGVWVDPNTPSARKVAAIGVRIERGRTLHGVALNVAPDLGHFEHIIPCGIREHGVTSMAAEGVHVEMREVVDAFAERFAALWAPSSVERSDVVWRSREVDLAPFSRGAGPGVPTGGANRRPGDRDGEGTPVRLLGRLAEAGVSGGVELTDRKPEWMRAPVRHDRRVLELKHTIRDLDLVTVCEEAGCPNLSECWSEGTATFMVCGERCTRACGFCLVDTRHPEPLDPDEPGRVAAAVERMGLDFAVITMVARDDLPDGGAAHVADTIRAIRERRPGTQVEALISDLRGDPDALATVVAARPDVLNHNIETVARLQRAVRPSASYARSLAVLSLGAQAGLTTKSGLVLGMGETEDEVAATLADLAAVGVSIVTIGQYLRPTSHHLPVARWWEPADFDRFARLGEELGIAHVESSPFTRSSYHARGSAQAAEARR
ncbi:MAG TPA: lipoyl synthase [Microthrixaceae bacterium]|nr:lipoyl synthase [Microthrixaceae bacterium]